MFICQMIGQIQRFNFINGNHTSIHLKIIEITLHQRIQAFTFSIKHIRNIIDEYATRLIIFLETTLKMILLGDLMVKKTIEPQNVILAQ